MDKTAREIQCFRLAAFDVNIDELEVKEWLRPDADPSDYFNYGMGEDTWRQYRDQQLILRRSLQERRAAMAQAAAREAGGLGHTQCPPRSGHWALAAPSVRLSVCSFVGTLT